MGISGLDLPDSGSGDDNSADDDSQAPDAETRDTVSPADTPRTRPRRISAEGRPEAGITAEAHFLKRFSFRSLFEPGGAPPPPPPAEARAAKRRSTTADFSGKRGSTSKRGSTIVPAEFEKGRVRRETPRPRS